MQKEENQHLPEAKNGSAVDKRDSGNQDRRFDPNETLYRAAFSIVVSLFIGLIAGYVVYRFVPLRDPIGVVGVPLLTGYSERSEQFAFYAFCVTSLVLGVAICYFARRFPPRVIQPLGALAVLVVTVLVAALVLAALPNAASYSLIILVSCIVFCFGATSDTNQAFRLRKVCWLMVMMLSAWAIPRLSEVIGDIYVALLDDNYLIVILIFQTLAVSFHFVLIKTSPTLAKHLGWPWLNLAMVMAASGVLLLCPLGEVCRFATIGVIGYVLGHLAKANRCFVFSRNRAQWHMLLFAIVVVLMMPGYSIWVSNRWVGIVMILVGAWIGSILVKSDLLSVSYTGVSLLDIAPLKSIVLAASIFALALLLPSKPWFASLMVTCAALISFKTRPLRPRFVVAMTLGMAMYLAVCQFDSNLPHGFIGLHNRVLDDGTGRLSSYVDKFHDGQILSAVWEFENGRRLFSEVCPLRTFEFFATWIGRKFFPPTHEGYVFVLHLLGPLTYVGVCLVSFTWTRSLAWSFSTTVVAMCWLREHGRFGMHLCLAGLAMELLRKRSSWCWPGLVAVGCVAGLVGYDCFLSVVAAIVAALFVSPLRRRADATTRVRLAVRCIQAFAAGFGTIMTLTLFLMIWQGTDSAGAFWYLFVEYARNYPAFYGVPIDWNDYWTVDWRVYLTLFLMTLNVWTVGGVWAWKSMRPMTCRLWCFLLVFYVVFLHRVTAPSFMNSALFPTFLLLSIGSFELLSQIRRMGCRIALLDRKVVALSLAALAAWHTPKGAGSPLDLLREFRSLSARETRDLGQDEFVLRNVAEDETLWGIDKHALTNYANRRHNPTRYSVAYVIPSPAEQCAVVADLCSQPPALIVWPKYKTLTNGRGIPFSLRYYVIAQHLFRHYKPSSHPGYLKPAEDDWPGLHELDSDFNFRLDLGHLPLTWGKFRRPRMLSNVLDKQELNIQKNDEPENHKDPKLSGTLYQEFETRNTIDSRRYNYLLIQLAGRKAPEELATTTTTIKLEYAPPNGEFDTVGQITFDILADGLVRPYLIPIGCSPGWSWRRKIGRVRLFSDSLQQLSIPMIECWQFDDVAAADTTKR